MAFYRASSLDVGATRHQTPELPSRAWKLGGPQLEGFRNFLETVVEPNVAPESLVAIRPLFDDPQDSLVLAAIGAYLMPSHRVLHFSQYVAFPIETDRTR